jgi:hypothetical protein
MALCADESRPSCHTYSLKASCIQSLKASCIQSLKVSCTCHRHPSSLVKQEAKRH